MAAAWRAGGILGVWLGSFLVVFLVIGCSPKAQDNPPPDNAKTLTAAEQDQNLDRNTPEGTLRLFSLAMLQGDAKLLQSTTVPLEADELQILVGGQKPPGSPAELRAQAAGIPLRRLKVGDKFMLGMGKEITVPPEDVNDNAAVLVITNAPTPTRMLKHEGRWLVDPFPIIAARKAAKAAAGK